MVAVGGQWLERVCFLRRRNHPIPGIVDSRMPDGTGPHRASAAATSWATAHQRNTGGYLVSREALGGIEPPSSQVAVSTMVVMTG